MGMRLERHAEFGMIWPPEAGRAGDRLFHTLGT